MEEVPAMAQQGLFRFLKDAFMTLKEEPRKGRMMREKATEEKWRSILTGEDPRFRRGRAVMAAVPARERCKNCNAPFTGVAGAAMRMIGRGPYDRNPRFCDW